MFIRLALIVTILSLTPTASFADSMSVAFSGADIRTAPSAAASRVIFTASRYYPVEVLSAEKEYYKIKDYRGRTGYIHKSLLKPLKSVVVTSDKVNVRLGPGTDNDVVTQLAQGDAAKLISQTDGWVEIVTARGDRGWIADFLVYGE